MNSLEACYVMKLFTTSGIRRKVTELPPSFVVNIGLAISKAMCNNDGSTVVVARDARLSGPALENAICSGLMAGGCNVERKGILPTPALAYHTHKTDACVGVMLTASHNPAEYNGIKVFDKTSMGLFPEDEQKIEKAIFDDDLPILSWEKFGKQETVLGSEIYEKMLLDAGANIATELFDIIVLDPGGGAGSEIIPKIYEKIGFNQIAMNAVFDPYFKARPSEPNDENLSEIANYVKKLSEKKKGKVIGLAFDGDADRCVAVDEKGRFVPLDVLIALYSKHAVEKNNNKGTIVTHVGASMLVDKLVGDVGGKVIRTKVGDVAIGNAVATEKAIFGGEPVGAWIFPEYHLCPDGVLTGIKILEWVAESGPLAKLVDEVDDFPVNRAKIPCDNEVKPKVLKDLDEKLSAKDKYKNILKIDGLRFTFEDDSWVLIRPSGTEPYFRVTSQATTQKESLERMEEYSQIIKKSIKKF